MLLAKVENVHGRLHKFALNINFPLVIAVSTQFGVSHNKLCFWWQNTAHLSLSFTALSGWVKKVDLAGEGMI